LAIVICTTAGVMCRKLRKEKRKEHQRQKAAETGVDFGPSRKALKRNTMKNSRCEITVAVDLSFDALMSVKVLIVSVSHSAVSYSNKIL